MKPSTITITTSLAAALVLAACGPQATRVSLPEGPPAEAPPAEAPPPTAPPAVIPAPPPSVVLPANQETTISVAVWLPVGSQDDPAGKEGLAWLTAQLITRGATADQRYEDILTALYPMAAGYDATVDKEMTVLHGRVHRDHAGPYLRLFTDAYTRPAFAAADLERLRAQAISGLEKGLRYAQDEELGKAAFIAALDGGTRYAHPVIGTVAGLKAITVADVRAFWEAHYAGNLATFGLAGGWTDEIRATVEGSRAAMPAARAAVAPPPPPAPVVKGRRVVLVNKPGADASISFGKPLAVKRGDRAFYALWLAVSWLGEHRNSSAHLYRVIREARGLNYGDYAYIEAYPNGGRIELPPTNVGRRAQAFEVWIRTLPNNNAVFALRAALREIDHLVERGLTAEQFELQRAFLRKYILHFAESTDEQLRWAIDDRYYGLDQPHLARFRAVLDELTLDEVNAAIRTYLTTDDLVIAIATGDPDGLRAALTGDQPTPPTYATAKPDAIMKEDVEIASWPLRIAADAVRIVPVEEMFQQ